MALTISFIAYSLFIILVGLYSTKLRKKTQDDFVLANRELGPWASALSASASSESGWVMLGLVGEAFQFGLAAIWIVPGIAVGYIFNWWVVADRLRTESLKSGAVTLPQYLLHRYGARSRWLRIVPVAIITLSMLGYVAAQMNAAGKAFDAVFHMPYWIGVLAGAAIIMAYTITGGFRAICWTDIIQASFMAVALIGMPIILATHVGDWSAAKAAIGSIDESLLTFTTGKVGFAAFGFIIGLLGIGLGYPGQPHVLSRFMAARDKKTIDRGRIIAMTWFVLVYVGAVIFGLYARAHWGELADPEQALPLACDEFLPGIIGGFVIAAIVAAICSTADSQLIVVSSTISRDVIPAMQRNAGDSQDYRRIQNLDRWVLITLAVIAVLLALTENRVIFHFVLYAWSALGASFGPVVILGLLWKKANKQGAIAGMLTGAIVTVVWRETPALKAMIYELVPAFILAFLVVVVVSLATQKSESTVAA